MWRRLLAFLVAPIAGAAAISLVMTIRLTSGRLMDYPIEHYSVFITNWLGGATLIAVVMYLFTLLLVVPAYLFLIHRKSFSLKSMLIVGLGVGIVADFALSLIAGEGFNIVGSVTGRRVVLLSGLVGLLSGLVFFMIHGPQLKSAVKVRED